MSGRRSHPRYAVATPWDGAMRVLRGVLVQRTDDDELHAISQAPGIAGEEMTLDLMGGGTTLGLRVRVIDSRPVMVEGAVRHQIRLERLDNGSEAAVASEPVREAEVQSEVQSVSPIAAGESASMEAV